MEKPEKPTAIYEVTLIVEPGRDHEPAAEAQLRAAILAHLTAAQVRVLDIKAKLVSAHADQPRERKRK